MNIKKTIIITLLINLFLIIGLSPVFADEEVKTGCTPLAKTPAYCHSQRITCHGKDSSGNPIDDVRENTIPRNCLFLEEPIGGKKGYDLYIEKCTKKDEVWTCKTTLWGGGGIGANNEKLRTRGPIQAILTEDASKPYQGPFTLLYNYLGLIYKYMSGIIVGIAVLFVVIGGIQMTTSYGEPGAFEEGKKRIQKAIVGMILWFTASLILYTINPTFFSF